MRNGSAIFVIGALLAAATASSAATRGAPGGRSAAQRDVEGYAIASCLLGQDAPYLKDQGDGWASVIVQRGKGDLEVFASVASAVKAELEKREMAVIRSEEGTKPDKPLPVLYCGEIIDKPSVRAAIEAAVAKLARAYRGE